MRSDSRGRGSEQSPPIILDLDAPDFREIPTPDSVVAPAPVVQRGTFLTDLPPGYSTPFRLRRSYAAATPLGAVGAYVQQVYAVPPYQTLVILSIRNMWMVNNVVVGYPDALQRTDQDRAANGKVGFSVLIDDRNPFTGTDVLFDTDGSTLRRPQGSTELNENLLDYGAMPGAIYCTQNQRISFQWDVVDALAPTELPAVIMGELQGVLVPQSYYEQVMEQGRTIRT